MFGEHTRTKIREHCLREALGRVGYRLGQVMFLEPGQNPPFQGGTTFHYPDNGGWYFVVRMTMNMMYVEAVSNPVGYEVLYFRTPPKGTDHNLAYFSNLVEQVQGKVFSAIIQADFEAQKRVQNAHEEFDAW